MIKIIKGKTPKILADKGNELTEQMQIAFANGGRNFEFDSAVYGGKTVKNALIKLQYNKCCFCESTLHAQHGDVEHFRPKGGWKQDENDQLSEFGYYWLAYNWENLFLSCQKCNQTFKKNFFPLQNPHLRAINHTFDIAAEEHLIINPATDNPEEHIFFKREVITSKTTKGNETIKRTAIDQETFENDRKYILDLIQTLVDCLKLFNENQLDSPDGQTIIQNIKELIDIKKPYYAMLRDNFKTQLASFGIEI